jgi:hypothetical protein
MNVILHQYLHARLSTVVLTAMCAFLRGWNDVVCFCLSFLHSCWCLANASRYLILHGLGNSRARWMSHSVASLKLRAEVLEPEGDQLRRDKAGPVLLRSSLNI